MEAEVIQFNAEVEDPKCNFCKTPKSKAKRMVASPTGKQICDKCIIKCTKLIEASNNEKI